MREGNKAYRGRNVKDDYLCRGMVTCLCGWAWTVRTCHSKGQTGKCGYYGCARKDHQPERVHEDCPGTIGSKKLDAFVWEFVVNICQNPEIVQNAIDAKIARLQEELGDIEHEAEQLQRELDRFEDERQWVITTARKGKISDDDMEGQLSAIDFQAMELRKNLDDKLSAMIVQQQTERLKDWANQYLSDLANGLRILETDIELLSEVEMENLYIGLGANRFEEKYEGDQLAALKWAILEERRRTVRMIVDKVLVVKNNDGSKRIVPQLSFELPAELSSLVYDYQSLSYVEEGRTRMKGEE
jgi:hypothetical protein